MHFQVLWASEEMDLLILDGHVSERWRSRARQQRQVLDESLLLLQDLYQIAIDFGLYHVVLVIADLSSSVQEREAGFEAWLRCLLPKDTPYSPGQMQVPSARCHGMFPLLLVRRSTTFLQLHTPQLQPAAGAIPEDFQARAVQLLAEMSEALKTGSELWDAGCVATLLEFCSCLWHKVSGFPVVDAWVPLKVLARKPFQMPMVSLLRFYVAVLSHSASWAADLRKKHVDGVSDKELSLHLAQVALILVEKAQPEGADAAQALLKEIRSSLAKLDKDPLARRLLSEAERLADGARPHLPGLSLVR